MAEEDKEVKVAVTWMSDVQRLIAMVLILTYCFVTLMATLFSLWQPTALVITDMAKTLQQNLTNMGLIALGFFFGNTMAKMAQDVGQQKVVEKLTSPPPNGPVAPVPSPTQVVVVSWWSLLTDEEKKTIQDAALTDPRVQVFLTAAPAGRAVAEDMEYLVSKNLLTRERYDFLTKDRTKTVATP